VITGAEVIIPLPFLAQFDQFRFSAFVDGGNVFCTSRGVREIVTTTTTPNTNTVGNTLSIGETTTTTETIPICNDADRFNMGNLRYSAGLGAVWMSPLGVMSFSLSTPFNDKLGDRPERFQFNIGTSF
jgi:outer membrane protein assembly factor BamA